MTRTLLDNVNYDVLNTIALKKMAAEKAIADASGVSLGQVATALDDLESQGLVVTIGTQSLPTDDAVPALVATAATRYANLRIDPAVLEMATKFEQVNGQFLKAISSWQQVDVAGRKITNDHSDSEYDSKVLDRLDKLVSRLVQLIAVLSHQDGRFDRYAVRFIRATDLVLAGDLAYVSSPTIESVHNIWFEFHEDLLRTLGQERGE
ncbi:hypothetical protein E3T55_11185 [Cryobacterium frigoriphilum]|uniref:Uncharacterized protein n=1 Tax=Cryobacterium frigoriphilum TaxID=1259150 RepID=A0A4V3IR43_9MICO|nr:hypothetical protein [Cryobacterium frigoriphilum]TFD49633.1 hypothetical protein E3T55_11185 [Cryobacterium frigoriphilum]